MDFSEWLKRNKTNKSEFCRRTGISYRLLNLWLDGSSVPVLHNFILFVNGIREFESGGKEATTIDDVFDFFPTPKNANKRD